MINEKEKKSGNLTVVVKADMKEIATNVMNHWYNVKGKDLDNFFKKNFDEKWNVLDNNGRGEIQFDEGIKFIRDLISGMI